MGYNIGCVSILPEFLKILNFATNIVRYQLRSTDVFIIHDIEKFQSKVVWPYWQPVIVSGMEVYVWE